MQKTVALHTLGCKLNFSETSAIGRMLEKDGFAKTEFGKEADVYVINTCSVTENADKECRQLVRRIQKNSPDATVVITGCYAQLKAEEIARIPGVDLVLGAAEKFNISHHLKQYDKSSGVRVHSCEIEHVNTFTASHSMHERTRVFLKVQDGCDYNCSFCTIPLARGQSRSDNIESVCNRVREIAEKGAVEIILTGINLGDFGKSGATGQKAENISDLVRELDQIEGISRFRISSIEPNLLSEDIIRFVNESKRFMPHFHIPLQSGSNKILGLMRRRYRKELYAEKVSLIKTLMPHCCIGVDVITGFPGEEEGDFRQTLEFLTELPVSYLHVFTYSERDNTYALSLPGKVPQPIRNERTKILRNLSYRKMQLFESAHSGEIRKVLFESRNANGLMDGYTDNYIKVSAIHNEAWENKIVDWQL